MTTSFERFPPPATLVISPQDVSRRWRPLWYGVFYWTLVVVTAVTLVRGPHPSWQSATLFGLSLLLGIWYGYCVALRPEHWKQHPQLTTGYLVIGWALWLGLTVLSPAYLFLLFGLYPQIFILLPLRWQIIDALLLTVLWFWQQVMLNKGVGWPLLAILGAIVSGIIAALFIGAILRQSRQRQQLLEELAATHQQLAAAERQAGVTQERQRLAREIHDTLAQGFTSIVIHLEAAEGALPSDMRTMRRHLDQVGRTARENLAEARRLMWALQPEALDRASLPEVLTNLAERWSEESTVSARATITGTARSLRPEIEVTLFRAAQETLANAGKYAQASQVTLTLSYMEDVVVLDVQDDGRGFDTAQLLASAAGHTSSGFGLKGLRERVAQLSGTLSIESTPGEGATIAVSLPALSNESFLCPEPAKEVSQ